MVLLKVTIIYSMFLFASAFLNGNQAKTGLFSLQVLISHLNIINEQVEQVWRCFAKRYNSVFEQLMLNYLKLFSVHRMLTNLNLLLIKRDKYFIIRTMIRQFQKTESIMTWL